jgi:F0F1-type ATP synthase beta subunit
VDLKDTIASFKAILNGEGDDLPEGAFYMGKQYFYAEQTSIANIYDSGRHGLSACEG